MIVTKTDILEGMEKYARLVRKGAIFVHPTDTIHGLGCDATNDDAVQKIRRVKKRENQPFSVIAPSKFWVLKNCELPDYAKEWFDKLPGPYTLILKLKNKDAISKYVNPKDETLGVRIPDNWFASFVSQVGVPVITTSANVQGEEYIDDLEELHPDIRNNSQFMIYDPSNRGTPSDIVFLTSPDVRIIKRGK